MTISDFERAHIEAMIAHLEANPWQPYSDKEFMEDMEAMEKAEYVVWITEANVAQRAAYNAAPHVSPPSTAMSFLDAVRIHLTTFEARLKKLALLKGKGLGKSAEAEYHEEYIATQWKYVWSLWDNLSDDDKMWFETPSTTSARNEVNYPKMWETAPLRVVLPDSVHFRTAAQLRVLRKRLDD